MSEIVEKTNMTFHNFILSHYKLLTGFECNKSEHGYIIAVSDAFDLRKIHEVVPEIQSLCFFFFSCCRYCSATHVHRLPKFVTCLKNC